MQFGGKGKEQPAEIEADGLDLALSDFLLENADPRKGYTARLFRVHREAGREKTAYLEVWRDSVPDYDEIATKYGPGSYRVNVIYNPPGKARTATSRTIHIDPEFGGNVAGRNVMAGGGELAHMMGTAQQQSQQMLSMFGMFLDSLVKFQQASKPNGNGGGGFAMLADMQKAMGESMIASYSNQTKLIDRMMRDKLDVGADEPEIDGTAPFVMQAVHWCMAAWDKYGKQILAAPKAAGGFLKGKAQGIPQIDYALSHPEEYEQLYNQFSQASGAPTNAIDDFIHGLGYPTPAELRTQTETGSAGE